MNTFLTSWTLLALALGVVNASALERDVQINNLSPNVIVEFYATNIGPTNWGENILGRPALPSGSSATVNIDEIRDFCNFDFLAVFEDGTEAMMTDNNVCQDAEFNFED